MNAVMNETRRSHAAVRTAGGRATELPWRHCTDAVEAKVLSLDLARSSAEVLLRFAPGYATGRHRHACETHIFVVEGAACNDTLGCDFVAGDYCYQPSGDVHAERFPDGAVLHLSLRGEGDLLVEFFGDDGQRCGELTLSGLAALMD